MSELLRIRSRRKGRKRRLAGLVALLVSVPLSYMTLNVAVFLKPERLKQELRKQLASKLAVDYTIRDIGLDLFSGEIRLSGLAIDNP